MVPRTLRLRARWLAALVLVSAFATLSASTLALAQTSGGGQAHKCGDAAVRALGQRAFLSAYGLPPEPDQRVVLTPEKDLRISIRFLRDRGFRTSDDMSLVYKDTVAPSPEAFPNGSQVRLDFGVLKRDSDDFELAVSERIVYSAQSTTRGVSLRLCFDATRAPPGRYQSTVELAPEGLQHSPIPLVVTVQENRMWLMIGILLSAVAVGVVLLYQQARLGALGRGGQPQTFRDWLWHSWAGLGTGLAAAWGTWQVEYLSNESFGGEGVQYVLLLGACIVAFAGGGVAGSVGYGIVDQSSDSRARSRGGQR